MNDFIVSVPDGWDGQISYIAKNTNRDLVAQLCEAGLPGYRATNGEYVADYVNYEIESRYDAVTGRVTLNWRKLPVRQLNDD